MVKKRLILLFAIVFIILSSSNVISGSGRLEIKDPNAVVVAFQLCNGIDNFICQLDYRRCGEIGTYTAWFTMDNKTVTQEIFSCNCVDNTTECRGNRYRTCIKGDWVYSGDDADE
ncbi:hypothetical protein CMO93_03045 [Candidatus Woesearchaeota archaeon]|nr:hypothetical protein [Candidatus Woesearchaeota archaeon]|tara:strand:- start:533 stop:877 length:345 start_codon:yes stop_codon:yes gene_type:complete